jgi:hypothetical protein
MPVGWVAAAPMHAPALAECPCATHAVTPQAGKTPAAVACSAAPSLKPLRREIRTLLDAAQLVTRPSAVSVCAVLCGGRNCVNNRASCFLHTRACLRLYEVEQRAGCRLVAWQLGESHTCS